MAQKWGRLTFKSNGNAFATESGGAELTVGGVTREGGMTDQNTVFHTEARELSKVVADVVMLAGTDIIELQSIVDEVGTFEVDTGDVYSIREMFFGNSAGIQNGKCKVTFYGAPAEKV